MSLPETFNDIVNNLGEVVLDRNVSLNGDEITIPVEIVKSWLVSPEELTGKAQEYYKQWQTEGRI